jgi:hypothetical protein
VYHAVHTTCDSSGGGLSLQISKQSWFSSDSPDSCVADNETCIAWSEGSVGGSERVYFVHEAHTAGHLQLDKVESKLNAADILTKASTPTDVYEDLCRRIMGY